MAKPRIFLSSTCFDLNDVRSSLSTFLTGYGFEVLNSQDTKVFGVNPGTHSHTACLDEVENSDYLVLIVGGRAGSPYVRSLATITNEEFNRAQQLKIPVIAFVRRSVFESMNLYKKNPQGDFRGIVDNVKVFHFIDYISSGHESNWIHPFDNGEDIVAIVKAQFAHYLLNYSKLLRAPKKANDKNALVVVPLPDSLPHLETISCDQDALTALRKGTQLLHDIIKSIVQAEGSENGKIEKLKTLWIFGLYDEDEQKESFYVRQPIFRDKAWSFGKADRVFQSMSPLGFVGSTQEVVPEGYDREIPAFSLYYKGVKDGQWNLKYALTALAKELNKKYGEGEGFKLFCRGDFRLLGDE
ncbi:MAG: DUF4062 domain-containing protein [Verrucomicrobiota bacterium]